MSQVRHNHWTCGQGPGWSCLREESYRPLDIMRVCRLLYQDSVRILYNRVFEILVGYNGVFFIDNHAKAPSKIEDDQVNSRSVSEREIACRRWFAGFPFELVKCTTILVETFPNITEANLTDLVANLSWICDILAARFGPFQLPSGVVNYRLKRLEFHICARDAEEWSEMDQRVFSKLIGPIKSLWEQRMLYSVKITVTLLKSDGTLIEKGLFDEPAKETQPLMANLANTQTSVKEP
jgi:hypothetical protein